MRLTVIFKFFNIVILTFCIFVATEQKRIKPILFIYDKALPMGNIPEKGVRPVLDCSVNPKGSAAYKTFLDMTEKKVFVTSSGVSCNVAFFNCFFKHLTYSRTENEAFKKASQDYFNLFGEYCFKSLDQFKNKKHGTT